MSETDFSDRLQRARIAAGFSSPREAAQRFGWNENTYKSREAGIRGIPKSQDQVRIYARAFGVSFLWLLAGQGEMDDEELEPGSFSVMVMGKIGAGSTIFPEYEQVPEHGLYEVVTPFPVPLGAIAFEIEGNSMWPRYDEGDIVVCWRQGSNLNEVIGWEAAIRTSDGHRYLKRILQGSEPGTFDLESHNAPTIRNVRIDWVAQVHAVVRADMWKRATPKQKTAMQKRLIAAMAK